MRESTKSQVFDLMIYDRDDITEEDEAKAMLVRDWLLTKEIKDTESLEYNCLALVESGYTDLKHVGYLAYLPVAYDKAMEREKKRKEMAKACTSQYVGEVGKRIEFHPASAKIVTSWFTQFGVTHIWRILDENGNVFTWKTSISNLDSYKNGETIAPKCIKGTVKAHTDYKGICQTELTRCRMSY